MDHRGDHTHVPPRWRGGQDGCGGREGQGAGVGEGAGKGGQRMWNWNGGRRGAPHVVQFRDAAIRRSMVEPKTARMVPIAAGEPLILWLVLHNGLVIMIIMAGFMAGLQVIMAWFLYNVA